MEISSATSMTLKESTSTSKVEKKQPSEKDFLTYIKVDTRRQSLLILCIMLCELTIFKILYPFPDFFSDSYSYLQAAYMHLDVNIWPIGYSRFLLLFHGVTHSATALIYFQYLVYAFSALYFYHTLVYFFPTGKNTRLFLYIFLFLNPLFLYLSNYVSSDLLFASLSLIWATLMIWILKRPKPYMIALQAFLVFILFTFRYNAMVYPFIAILVFALAKQKMTFKIIGILSAPILIIPFIIFSANAAKKMTGTAQFPPILGGWQWGNNALYFREHINVDSTQLPTPESVELDRLARTFFATVPYEKRDFPNYVGNYFIRQWDAPLKQYMTLHYKPKTAYDDIAAWGKVAVVFDVYGKYIVKKYPFEFARYFMLMNAKNYFIPPLEKLELYNLGENEMWDIAQYWFNYPSPKMKVYSKDLQGVLLALLPILFLILNIYLGVASYLFVRRDGLKSVSKQFKNVILFVTVLLALNCAFSIFANIVVFRYQVFPMIILLGFCMILTDQLEILGSKLKSSDNNLSYEK